MQIILSSAKLMNAVTKMEQNKYTVPLFQNKAESFALELAQHSIEELKQELKCSTSLAQMAKQNFIDFFNQENKLPAILAYNGQAYKCLKAHTLTNSDIEFANKHLWILSFLYGMLRPHNLIHPYRLEGKIVLNASNDKCFRLLEASANRCTNKIGKSRRWHSIAFDYRRVSAYIRLEESAKRGICCSATF